MKRYGILDNITSPADLRGLSYDTLNVLCASLREFIVDSVSRTGGHLASNLGIVELAVALEREFDSSRDRIIYDVGHQSYVHKILTGRRDRFDTLRQYGGLSGFMKPEESVTDPCVTGHASDSVSVALGMAHARTLRNQKYHVVAVIGDGALTGGMAYEALSNAGTSGEPLLVVLNDNNMSIAQNVGGLSRHLARLRVNSRYLRAKVRVKERLARIVVGYTRDDHPVTAGDLKAQGAMAALLKDAIDPNLVQTLENNPAIIHGGPFANIAHGCNSVTATKLGLKLADYVVTEAGFGADLGAEKFLDIKCRYAGLTPSAVVLVATVRALKYHGGVPKTGLNAPDAEAVRRGAVNLARHIDNLKNGFGLPVCVAINAFPTDTEEEYAVIREVCEKAGVPCELSEVFAKGGEGGKALAKTVLSIIDANPAPAPIQYTYDLDETLEEKIDDVAKKIYRAGSVSYAPAAKKMLAELEKLGYGKLPVCIAKTQYSFSDDASLLGAPEGFTMNVREVRLSAGAGFVVVICGSIMTMPGLPKHPAAMDIDCDAEGKITGLF